MVLAINESLPMVDAWGGFQACKTFQDCATSEFFDEPVFNPSCTRTALLAGVEKFELTEERYCTCTVVFKTGRQCLDVTDPYSSTVVVLNSFVIILCVYVVARSMPFFCAKNRKYNAAFGASLQALLSLIGCIFWAVANSLLVYTRNGGVINASRIVIDIIGMVFSSTMGVGALITISQSWFETFNSMKPNALARARKLKLVGRAMFLLYVLGMIVVMRLQNYLIATIIAVTYTMVIASLYFYLGQNLKKAFSIGSSSSNKLGASTGSAKVVKRIKTSITRVVMASVGVSCSFLLTLPALNTPVALDQTDSAILKAIRVILVPCIVFACAMLASTILSYAVPDKLLKPCCGRQSEDKTDFTTAGPTNDTTVETYTNTAAETFVFSNEDDALPL